MSPNFDVTSEEAIDMAKTVARTEGLPVGLSSGAALAAAIKVGQKPEMAGKNMVVILASAVERYLSLGYFD